MANRDTNINMVSRLLFRLLPIQILLCVIGAVNTVLTITI